MRSCLSSLGRIQGPENRVEHSRPLWGRRGFLPFRPGPNRTASDRVAQGVGRGVETRRAPGLTQGETVLNPRKLPTACVIMSYIAFGGFALQVFAWALATPIVDHR